MAIDEGSIPVGSTGKLLRTFEQTTSEGLVHSEALSIVDPEDVTQVAKVTNAAPAANDPGLVVRVVGSLVLGSEVEIKNDTGNPVPVSNTGLTNLDITLTALAALLESITVQNFPGDYPSAAVLAKLELIRLLLAATLTVQGTVALDAPTLAALETINAIVSGTVAVSNFPATQPVSGTVAVSNFPASVEVSNDAGNPLPVSGAFFQATQPVSIAATVTVSGPLTDTQLRATPVPVSGTVTTGGLTDTQLRATPVPVSGTVTANTGLSQPLTDTQLRATPVPVSGTVTATGPLTDTQLRASSVPVTSTPASVSGTLANGAETAVSSSAVQVIASNVNRKVVILQNTGTANVRIGVTGVTATTGIRLASGDYVTIDNPFITTQALFAIREGAVDSIVLAMEIT